MVNKILFWTGFGIAVRLWQLGIEMRPIFSMQSLWAYPVFGGIGGSFGYWMQNVSARQYAILDARRERLLEKRARRAEREARQQESGGSQEIGVLSSNS
ncbi:MAG: hypothetical protein M1825_006512 [Sarcosagium campestre]|nr:MAG: hypothetical protein M1825_006512 [Sarcosagium campestre]